MNLEMLRTVSQYVSVIALLVSIVALISQIRRHAASIHAQNYGKALDRLAAVQSRLSADPAMARVLNQGARHVESLGPEQRIQFTWMFYEIFGAFEFMYDEARRGTLPPHVWDRWAATLAWWISLPGVTDWWRNKPTPFSERFSEFVEECIRTPKFDVAAASRWNQFLGR
jgi:hypothetical protein